MKLKLQKRLASSVMNCSEKRVIFDPAKLEDIKEAITKTDIRLLVGEGLIKEKPKRGVSRSRANKIKVQKSKGLRKGQGSRKGKASAREPKKEAWMRKIRAQRNFLKSLREKNYIQSKTFMNLYRKSSGGFFRSVNHIKLFIKEHKLLVESVKKKTKVQKK